MKLTPTAASKTNGANARWRVLRKILAVPEMGVLIPLLGFALLFTCINRSFLSAGSIVAMLRAIAFVGIIAVGFNVLRRRAKTH